MSDEPRGRGRPTKYNPETHLVIVQALAKRGLTIPQLAETLEVAPGTLNRWMAENEDFREAIKEARQVADDSVEASLFQRATGYSQKAVKIFLPAGASEPVIVPFIERFPPDPTSMIFWLKNRKPKEWRDKQEVEHTGAVQVDLSKIAPEKREALTETLLGIFGSDKADED